MRPPGPYTLPPAQPLEVHRVWSVTHQEWVESNCGGCPFHIPDFDPETSHFIEWLDEELSREYSRVSPRALTSSPGEGRLDT